MASQRLLSQRAFNAVVNAVRPTLMRGFYNKAMDLPVPQKRGPIQSHTDFLTSLGRDAATKLKVESWKELWRSSGVTMKAAGVPVSTRRYILWAMHKYRQGEEPAEFVKPPKPKKTIRGWGPKVQQGKLIRSRRKR